MICLSHNINAICIDRFFFFTCAQDELPFCFMHRSREVSELDYRLRESKTEMAR